MIVYCEELVGPADTDAGEDAGGDPGAETSR
jgi:hypothetical protein